MVETRRLKQLLRYVPLIFLSALFISPFVWMLATSLTAGDQILNRDRPLFPARPVWSNYVEALTILRIKLTWNDRIIDVPAFAIFLKNSVIVAVLGTIGQTFSCACVAFAFARLRFPGRDVLFFVVLATMMLPGQVTMIPRFILFAKIGWIDSLKPLIVPSFFALGAYYIFLLRQFFKTIPTELEEAARLDGCSTFGVFWYLVIPLSKPALVTVAIFSFISSWNDFLGPLIYTHSMELKTLPLGLNAFKTLEATQYHFLMAASVVVLVPILIIFFCAQRYFVEGVVMSGVKG
jgi:multiple sugar transport system permease protein